MRFHKKDLLDNFNDNAIPIAFQSRTLGLGIFSLGNEVATSEVLQTSPSDRQDERSIDREEEKLWNGIVSAGLKG